VARVLSPPNDAEQFDSETLWPLLQAERPWQGERVLWLRGDGGRDWLIERLRGEGAQVDVQTIYRRSAAPLPEAQLQALLASPALWLFSSSEALGHLAAARPELAASPPPALFTHSRIADSARALGWQLGAAKVVPPRPADVARAYHAWVAELAT
jgi:uroporphyrinogen-III synthase